MASGLKILCGDLNLPMVQQAELGMIITSTNTLAVTKAKHLKHRVSMHLHFSQGFWIVHLV